MEEAFANALLSILNMFLAPIESIIRMFPEMTSDITGTWPEQMAQYVTWMGNIFDLGALTIMVTTIVTFEIAILTVRLILKVYSLLPLT